jgi:hypothetical protein
MFWVVLLGTQILTNSLNNKQWIKKIVDGVMPKHHPKNYHISMKK